MPTARHTHYLLLDGPTTELDPHATALALASRGRVVLTGVPGDDVRADRDCLAALLAEFEPDADGVLSDLLISDRPIRVDAFAFGYLIEEV